MSGNLVEILVGAMVLLVAGIFPIFPMTRGCRAVSEFSLTARFVKTGGNVMPAGIEVGAVTHQSLDSDEFPAVSLQRVYWGSQIFVH